MQATALRAAADTGVMHTSEGVSDLTRLAWEAEGDSMPAWTILRRNYRTCPTVAWRSRTSKTAATAHLQSLARGF